MASRGRLPSGRRADRTDLEAAQPFLMPALGQEPVFLNQARARQFPKEQIAFLGVPIMLHGAPLGVFCVDRLFGDEVSRRKTSAGSGSSRRSWPPGWAGTAGKAAP